MNDSWNLGWDELKMNQKWINSSFALKPLFNKYTVSSYFSFLLGHSRSWWTGVYKSLISKCIHQKATTLNQSSC